VSADTTSVLLEAANFEPVGILRSSERLGLRTEGSNRWEKGVDPHRAGPSATLATRLIVELAGARWTADADVQATLPEPAVITLRPERANSVIGLDVPAEEQVAILGKLGFDRADAGFRVPTWRARDVTREIDLVEEVARFKMDEIPFTLPERDAEPFLRPGRSARTREGWVGELHPALLEGAWGAFELDLDGLVDAAPEAVEFEEVSPYPEVRQDLAFVVDEEVPAAALADAIRLAAGPGLRSLAAFDE